MILRQHSRVEKCSTPRYCTQWTQHCFCPKILWESLNNMFQKLNGKNFMLFSIGKKKSYLLLMPQLSFQSQQRYVQIREIRISRNSGFERSWILYYTKPSNITQYCEKVKTKSSLNIWDTFPSSMSVLIYLSQMNPEQMNPASISRHKMQKIPGLQNYSIESEINQKLSFKKKHNFWQKYISISINCIGGSITQYHLLKQSKTSVVL